MAVFPWGGHHLHEFDFAPASGPARFTHAAPHGKTLAAKQLRTRMKFSHRYDFGDGWEHEVAVEKLLPAEPGVRYPRCIDGKRAAPPDDCGGPWGYRDLLVAIDDPRHQDFRRLTEWMGGPFDPAQFFVEVADGALERIRKRMERRAARVPAPAPRAKPNGG